jgi:broad specificity phosphatase PhoE
VPRRPSSDRIFVFARHAESTANVAGVVSSDPADLAPLTARGVAQAQQLGAQIAGLEIDLGVATRFPRTQQTLELALQGRGVRVLIEPGFDEIRAGDFDGEPIEAYWSWKERHSLQEPLPNGESVAGALLRYAAALRRLLARSEGATLAVVHELALRRIAQAVAHEPSSLAVADFANATPYLFDEPALRRAAAALEALAEPAAPRAGAAARL